jgi:hypothetical protein
MPSNDLMQSFRAEIVMGADAEIFSRITALRDRFQYATEGERTSFDSYFTTLRQAVDEIPQLELDTDVAPGTENQYSMQLASTMEQIVDTSDRILRKLAHFQGRLRDAMRQNDNLKAEFVVWYLIAASAILKSVKLPLKDSRAFAEAEFSRFMDNVDIRIISLLDDLKLEFDRVASHKAAQREKHNLGKDQANASWTSAIPSFGGAVSENRSPLTRPQDIEDEDDEVPTFITQRASVSSPPIQRDQIRGTFRKTVTSAAMQPVLDEQGNQVIQSEGNLAELAENTDEVI